MPIKVEVNQNLRPGTVGRRRQGAEMSASKKLRQNLAAKKLADALQEIADSEPEKILDRLQKALDSVRTKVLGGPHEIVRNNTGHRKRAKNKTTA